jgi:hypothetical protein
MIAFSCCSSLILCKTVVTVSTYAQTSSHRSIFVSDLPSLFIVIACYCGLFSSAVT